MGREFWEKERIHSLFTFYCTGSFNPDNLQENDTPEWVEEERQEFNERLDRDHNGLLDHKEVRDWMAPNEKEFHEEEANHLFNNVDKDKVCNYIISLTTMTIFHFRMVFLLWKRLRQNLIILLTVL